MTTTARPLVLNVTEAGNLLGVSRSTAYELVRSGELESVHLRRRVVIPVAVVADRLGITVQDVWLALGRRHPVSPAETGVAHEARSATLFASGGMRHELETSPRRKEPRHD